MEYYIITTEAEFMDFKEINSMIKMVFNFCLMFKFFKLSVLEFTLSCISQYSGWTPHNKNIYQKIPVQFIVQSRYETIVKFLRSEMLDPVMEQ